MEVVSLDRAVRQMIVSRPTTGKSSVSLSSISTEQARQEFVQIGGMVDELVNGVVSGVADAFPDSVPPTRSSTRDGRDLEARRENGAGGATAPGPAASFRSLPSVVSWSVHVPLEQEVAPGGGAKQVCAW